MIAREQAIQQATLIKNEIAIRANRAERVGTAMLKTIEAIDEHAQNNSSHIRPVPNDGMDEVEGASSSGIYSDEDYEYFVTYHHSNLFPSRRTYQLRLGKKTGTLEIRSKAGNQADWTDWTNLTDLKANKIVTPVTTYHYGNADSFEVSYQYFEAIVGQQITVWFDEQEAILEVASVDEDGNITGLNVIQEGISSYADTYAYAEWYDSSVQDWNYVEFEITGETVTIDSYTDLSAVRGEMLQLDAYLRSNFYTKSVADNTFQKKNTSATITKYAGENQLQARINEIQKFLSVNNNSSQYLIDIHIQGNQSASIIYVQGFVGGGTIRLIFDGNYTISGRLYINKNTSEIRVTSSSVENKGTINDLTSSNNMQLGVDKVNVSVLKLYEFNPTAVIYNDANINFIESNANAELIFRGNNIAIGTYAGMGKLIISQECQNLTFANFWPVFIQTIFDNRPGNPLDAFVRWGTLPKPPESGNYRLKSVDGVMQWVES